MCKPYNFKSKRFYFSKMLYYHGKTDYISNDIAGTLRQRKWIEIVPMNESSFDLIKFINFADCLSLQYNCTKFSHKGSSITIKAVHVDLPKDYISIKIVIKENFKYFNIYIRDGIKYMSPSSINGINYVCFKSFAFQENKKSFFRNELEDHIEYQNSVLFIIGNYISKQNANSPSFLKAAFKNFVNDRTIIRRESVLASSSDFTCMLQFLPGFVYYTYSDPPKQKAFTEYKLKRMGCLLNINGNNQVIRSVVWIAPWAARIQKMIQYIEIDASFKAVRPYAYCIFHGVIYNSSIPYAITLYPTEETKLYESLFLGLKKFHIESSDFENKNILSDLGTAIEAFSNLHSMSIKLCHRHIIERFGPKSGICTWVRKILKTKTLNDFLELRIIIRAEIEAFLSTKYDTSQIDTSYQTKIEDLEIMLMLPEEVDEKENNALIKKSHYYLPKWANWLRRDLHIPRCSNHSEGMHGNVNSKLKHKGIYSVKTGFSKIFDFIWNYLENRKNSYGESFQRKFSKIIEKVIFLLKEGPNGYLNCSNSECNCEDDQYNYMIYGVNFPCHHTVLNDFINSDFFQKFPLDQFIDYQEFFLLCFKFFPKSYFESKKFDEQVDLITSKIATFYISQHSNIFDEESHAILSELAFGFLQSFKYTLPPFLDINANKYSPNHILSDKDETSFTFKIRKKITDPIKIEEPEDFPLLLKNQISPNLKLIKKKYYETVYEIVSIYPKLSNKAENICFEYIMQYFYDNDQPNQCEDITHRLALFKIDCWQLADELANDNKFLE